MTIIRFFLFIVSLILGNFLFTSSPKAASFDCAKAGTNIEKMICNDSEVSKLDDDLAKDYQQALEFQGDKQKTHAEQRLWLQKVRNACQEVDCLKNVYRARINDLTTRKNQANTPSRVFQAVLAQVKTKTQIPILLPSELPAPVEEKGIHYADGDGEHNKYKISLFYDEDSGYAGFIGYFSGEAEEKIHFRKKVFLANGATGYFKRKSCGGSCSPSQIEWRQDNILYTIQLKLSVNTEADEEKAMISAANSAIRGGAR